MIDDEDYAKFIRTAKKKHKCSQCDGDILEGHQYQDNKGIVMHHSFKLCLECANGSDQKEE